MTIKELRSLVREMRKLGIMALKTADVELALSEVAPLPQRSKRQGKESKIEGNPEVTSAPLSWEDPNLSEEQRQHNALFWSVQDN